VFLSTKLPETVTVGGVDPLATYLAALNSHDGSMAFRLHGAPFDQHVVVCEGPN
jgi:hypothetical protein